MEQKSNIQNTMVKVKTFMAVVCLSSALSACNSGGDKTNDTTNQPAPSETTAPMDLSAMQDSKGVGPVSEVALTPAIDEKMAADGKVLFDSKCTACHNNTDVKKVGPGLKNVTKRRQPEWIMNMILNPSEMTQKDPVAKELVGIYIAQMANQSLDQDQARSILEYLRENDKQ